MDNRIGYINQRLKELEEQAKNASESYKVYLRVGYKAFLNEKKALLRKLEKEKNQEMSELQQKEEKKPPALIQRARERVEKYPGASG